MGEAAVQLPQQTVPVFSPDGTLGDIPQERLREAMNAGYKPGVTMKSKDGQLGVIPADRVQDAAKSGLQIVPIDQQETTHPGFWHSLYSDLAAMVTPHPGALGSETLPGRVAASVHSKEAFAAEDQARKAAGNTYPYRVAAQAGEGIGVNVKGIEDSATQGDMGGVMGHAVAVPTAMAATAALGEVATSPRVLQSAKVIGKTAGKIGDIATFERISKAGSAISQGAQKLADIWRKPEATLDNITDQLAQTIADDRARRLDMQSKGLGELPATGAKPAAQTGEALATQPTSVGPEPPKGGKSAAPRFTQQDRTAAQSLLKDALKQSSGEIVDKVISPDNRATNLSTKAQVDFSLSRGDVAGAEAALDKAAQQSKSSWTPPERQPAPSVNEIRERIQDEAKASKQADSLEDRALQQEMSYDLQRHGWSAEEEARREFIARNSTGFVKTQNREFGGPSLLSDQLPGEATPKIGKGAKAPAPASDDLTDILQKSLDKARQKRQQK